jgi:hypothetical protein
MIHLAALQYPTRDQSHRMFKYNKKDVTLSEKYSSVDCTESESMIARYVLISCHLSDCLEEWGRLNGKLVTEEGMDNTQGQRRPTDYCMQDGKILLA